MNRRTLVGVGIVVALLGLVVWWRLAGRGDDARTGSETASGSAGSAVARGGSSAAAKRGPVVLASASGRITQSAGGAGIAGARVSLARAELGADFLDAGSAATIQAVTDAQGAWTASNVTPGVYVLAAVAKGFLPGTRDKLLVASGERKTGIDLALARGGVVLSGTISDVGGGPIAGAEVTVTRDAGMSLHGGAELIAVAGDDGRYELTLADGEYQADASHADYTTESRWFELTGTPHTVDFTLTPGASIRGKVVTRDGKPLAGAYVQAEAGGGRGRGRDDSTTSSDDQGMFKLKSLDAGAISLKASGRGYASKAPTIVEVGIGEQVDGVTIIVDRAYSISGNVFEKGTKKGVAGVRLGVFSIGSGDVAFAFSPTEADGAFEIVGVKPASYMMFAIGDEVMPEIGKPVEVVDKDVTDVVVEMAGGVSVSGRVDPPGAADIGIAPTVVGIGNIFEAVKSMMVKAQSDSTGAFTLKHVPTGSFNVTAKTKDGSAGKVLVIVEAVDKTGVVIPLEKRSTLAGRVVDVKGAPVAGVRVMATPKRDKSDDGMSISFDDNAGPESVRTGADGAFKIVGLDEGKIGLRVSNNSGTLRWADAAHKDKPGESIVFDVGKGAERTGVVLTVETLDGVIRGNVTGVDRKPTADVWITATLTEKRDMTRGEMIMNGEFQSLSSSKPVLTGPDGTFVIERLRKGTYQIVAEAARGTARAEKSDIKTGDTVTLVLAPLGTLTGVVTAGGSPVTTYDLVCKHLKAEEDEASRRVTDAAGAYKLERLAPGELACSATADVGRASGKVTVPSGEAKLDLVLEPWATVTGTIVSALSGAPVPGVKLMISGDGFDPKQIADMLQGGGPTSDPRGVFTLSRIPPGKNELIVMAKEGGFTPLAKREFTTTSGQRLDLGTIKIVPPRTGEAGTLGMGTDITDGVLVVASVKPGGPAEAAGVQVGDKITSINGVAIAEVTPMIAQTLLASGTVGIGQQFHLGLDRAGTAAQVTILAVAW